ncbi:MAG: aminopeptidase [Clostridiales bacterium]|nr:aminopeptidase [Candidatus Apopatocola equi]
MKKKELRAYARLIARTGAAVQSGQEVLIYASLDQIQFVEWLTEECYLAGARKVIVEWSHDALTLLHTRYQSVEELCRHEDWELSRLAHIRDELSVHIYLESSGPDALAGIDQEKYNRSVQAWRAIRKPYRDVMDGRYQWCIAAVPGREWARRVFPGCKTKKAVKKLWKAILSASRAIGDGEKNWQEHDAALKARCDWLNSLQLRALHYTADNGTDLTVGLIPGCRFNGGSDTTPAGVTFEANIPSEECFTSPRAGEAEGIVYATKPLSYQGQLIEDFSLRFEGGRAVEAHAAKNEELLRSILEMDENAARLGEAALIPVESPISRSGLLFYSTLFDENASCHLALGDGFDECVPGFENMSHQQLCDMGINDSLIHVDFMIGCESMCIDGVTESGETVAIFRRGSWAEG